MASLSNTLTLSTRDPLQDGLIYQTPRKGKKKISLRRRIAERALQQAYKSFFNQSALRVRLHTQTLH